MRQVHYLTKTIERRKYDESEFLAKIQGAELKPRQETVKVPKEKKALIADQEKNALRRLQERYKARQASGGSSGN